MGSTSALCDSVVAVQDLFASSVGESDVCAQRTKLEQKYAARKSNTNWLSRPARADRPRLSRSEISAVGTTIILSLRTFRVQRMAPSECCPAKTGQSWQQTPEAANPAPAAGNRGSASPSQSLPDCPRPALRHTRLPPASQPRRERRKDWECGALYRERPRKVRGRPSGQAASGRLSPDVRPRIR